MVGEGSEIRRSSAVLRSEADHCDGSALSKTPNSMTLASKSDTHLGTSGEGVSTAVGRPERNETFSG